MTDRERVIKALEYCAPGNKPCDGCPMKDNCKGTANGAMAAAIKLLKEQEQEKLTDFDKAPTVGEWISAKDRLPEEDSSVLVWEKQGFAFVDWYKFGVWQLGAENRAIITHWMPLPDPPKEAEQG